MVPILAINRKFNFQGKSGTDAFKHSSGKSGTNPNSEFIQGIILKFDSINSEPTLDLSHQGQITKIVLRYTESYVAHHVHPDVY
ncbi:hypothetical protein L1887_17931 [Cichorium endivia]|nr:hypothetical protein L1887_17931 [Cichorium endivia]